MKTILLAVLIAMSIVVSAQKMSGYCKLGHDFDSNKNFTEIDLNMTFKFDNLRVIPFTTQKVWFETPNTIISMNKPFRQVYKLGVKIEYKKIFLNAYHHCSHLVYSPTKAQSDMINDGFNSSFNKDYAMRWLDEYNLGQASIVEIGFKF